MAAAAACLMIAGCGSVGARARPPALAPSGRADLPGQKATAAGNRAAARAEAARLLPLTRVPPGAARLARAPRSLPGPALGTPSVASLVDRVMAWRVRLPFAAARAWLSAHAPRGLRADGSTRGSNTFTGQTTMTGASYRGPASPAWQSADLEISAAPAGPRASVIRADAVIVWLDPRPVRSAPGAHPIRVTLASGCPPIDKGATGVANSGTGLARTLLPAGPPTAGLRCRYDGLNGNPWHLVSSRPLTAAAARRAAKSMARLPLSHPDGAVVNCPMDDGSAEVLALAYPGRPAIDLWVKLNGCRWVSNGYILAGAI